MPGMPSGVITVIVLIILGLLAGQCGVCMIIIGDVVIIFVTVVWPICSAYPNSVYFISEGTFTPAGPMTYEVFINSHWLEGSSDTLQVYGNVDEVKLQLNGRVIARQYPDDKPSTSEYVSRPDGGNAENIDFPPFTFFNVNWERGELKAIGYKDGKAVAEHVVRTPGAVEAMDITYFESGVSASCRDLLIVCKVPVVLERIIVK